MNKTSINAITEAAGLNLFPLVLEVFTFFQIMVGYQEFRSAFFGGHAAPNFRHEQTDVMIDAHFWADVTGSGDETVVPSQNPGDQRVVQIDNGRQRVEGT